MPDELAVLRAARSAREALYTVHYACQNLNEVSDSPPAVACVSFYDVNRGDAQAFGLANVGKASTTGDQREVLLLKAALTFMRDHSEARWLHWKMSRPEYGFQALADRYTWLEQTRLAPPPGDRRHDLSSLISLRHGDDFAPHPRLPSLVHLNGLSTRYARWGAEEPQLAAEGQFTAVQQSATEKVRLLANILDLLVAGRLQTANSAGEIEFAGAHLDAVAVVLALSDRFELVRRSLRRRHDKRETLVVNDEYDAQDLVRSLLVQFFDDVRDEAASPDHAGAASRIDFLLPQTRLAVELKWMRDSLPEKKLGEDLIVDRARYQKHPDVGHLVCLVFDPDGRLPNPRGLEEDLRQAERDDLIACTVRIIDR